MRCSFGCQEEKAERRNRKMLERIDLALENGFVAAIVKGVLIAIAIMSFLAFILCAAAIFIVSAWWIIGTVLCGLLCGVSLSLASYITFEY
jgi:hypothetical protein